jgi:threonine dehydratase
MVAAFAAMEAGANAGKTLMHPFEGAHMTLGAATCGLEYVESWDDVEVFVIPVGGGGLISGMAAAIKAVKPEVEVIGVEPVGADSLTRSLVAGKPVTLDRIDTMADSLSAPKALPYSFGVAQAHVDKMVHVTDDQMRDGMRDYLNILQIVAEPACAASLAAICGPLKSELAGRKIAIIACGSTISLERFAKLTQPPR